MARYKIEFKRSVAKDLRALPAADIKKILATIDLLAEDPRGQGCVKLSTQERCRVRQGQYRILYEIIDQRLIIQVVKVAHR